MTLASKPCAACPYLKSAPRGFWSPSEFANVKAQDHLQGRQFGCHLNAAREHKDSCVGWLADQKRRGIPNLGLRVELVNDEEELKRFNAINENDDELFPSIEAMVRANNGKLFPKRSLPAQRLVKKLKR